MTGPQLLSAYAGHWTGAGTGVTVILPPPGTVASGEVRGGAPATREFALLEPTRLVDRVDAVVLSDGSAFGLSAADGSPAFAAATAPEATAAPVGLANTTVAVVLTDARLSKNDCYLLAQSGHAGFARALHPAHSHFDGDAVVALATGEVTQGFDLELVRAAAAETVAAAIRDAAAQSSSSSGDSSEGR
ncbi:P1 family peptidase [Couchioplanes caeruleus]|uniref:Peptidase S58-like protein n=2 Tax=Couchioplanes caeruleus TaxID=56438 RepID=A0A1K0FET5_9ACTN|nr:P1 family peptidase [Couchioplanes caeruleus]OJF11343.1 hypothetical protein BG844_26900 [Couchioplanes caeruleus subsp. caeruleus]ROP34089.1 peptidase S58-like protein [Couchioplanes caeruleus]